jgi:hypothetical protein
MTPSILITELIGFFPILGMVISPPMMTMFDFTKVSQATRLFLSTVRQASRIASEMVSQTLSGWPSPTDSEEKMNDLLMGGFFNIVKSRCVDASFKTP